MCVCMHTSVSVCVCERERESFLLRPQTGFANSIFHPPFNHPLSSFPLFRSTHVQRLRKQYDSKFYPVDSLAMN